MASRWKYLMLALALLTLEGIIALYVHDRLIRPYLGDVLAVWAVYCLVRTVWPEGIRLLPLYVFLFAAVVEGSQYFHLAAVLGGGSDAVFGSVAGGDLRLGGSGLLRGWLSFVMDVAEKGVGAPLPGPLKMDGDR